MTKDNPLVPRVAPRSVRDQKAHARQRAKELYFKYYTMELAAEMSGCPYGSVRRWVYEGLENDPPWKQQRKALEEEALKAATEARFPVISEITGLTVTALREGLQNYLKQGNTPDINEMNQLSAILDRVCKLSALMTGAPTEITETRVTKQVQSMQDVKDIIEQHPFFEVTPPEDATILQPEPKPNEEE